MPAHDFTRLFENMLDLPASSGRSREARREKVRDMGRSFRSLYMAGFDCATGQNRHPRPLEQISATGHDARADEDYARLASIGIRTVRDASR